MNSDCKNRCKDDSPDDIQRTLCVVGDKWTALILRLLNEKPQRFKDFRNEIPEINPRTLAQRIVKLRKEGIIEKKHFDEPTSCSKYVLTNKGRALDEVIHSMAVWGASHKQENSND